MATSTIFNFNFNNSEIVDSTGQWYNATTGTPTTEFIEHDGNTALFQPALTNGDRITPNPTMLRSYDPNFKAYTYTLEVQVCAVLNRTSNSSFILNFPIGIDAGDFASALGLWYNDPGRLEMWIDYASLDYVIHPVLIDFSTAGFDRWFSVRIERTVIDPNNPYTGATVKAYVDGAEVYNQTFTYAQSTIRGMIGPRLRYCENLYATGGVAIDNLKLTAGIAPSSVVDVSLANLQRNNANLLSFIKGKVPAVNDGTLTIQKNGTDVATFSANSSTNATANITVPTKTSDLTNDSGFITSDNTKIPLAGSNAISGSLIPSTDGTVNLGGPSYQWNNAYIKSLTINGVACGDILTHNASEFVPRSGGAVMTGQLIARSSDDDSLILAGGTSNLNGASIAIFSTGFSLYNLTGAIRIALQSYAHNMYMLADGTWTWDGTACQITSDQRLKQQIAEIDDKLLDAWEDVNLVQFKYNDAVDQKGKDNARLHTGYVVQQIDKACKSHGVDVSTYGLYCHEEYPEETEEVEVEQKDGTKTKETKVIREASEHYSLRYTEVYAVECMYLRRCIARLTARIEQLEKEQEASK